jgi:hypothetical protein
MIIDPSLKSHFKESPLKEDNEKLYVKSVSAGEELV